MMKFSIPLFLLFVQLSQLKAQSTSDLSFLIGKWESKMVYSPEEEDTRTNVGCFECEYVLDTTFIKCAYEFKRPGRKRALNDVYFNYNDLAGNYEILWFSSTWPVKVLLSGELEVDEKQIRLRQNADFPIGDGITEYVRGELVFEKETKSYNRKTHIRTSKDPIDYWKYHSIEIAKKQPTDD